MPLPPAAHLTKNPATNPANTSPSVSVERYSEIILESDDYDAEIKTLIADMLRYIAAAKAVSGNEVSSLVKALLETAPVSEIPELPESAEGVDLTALAPYIKQIQVYYDKDLDGANLFNTERRRRTKTA